MSPEGMLNYISNKKQEVDIYEELTELQKETNDIQEEYKAVNRLKFISKDSKENILLELKNKFNANKEEMHNLIDGLELKKY